MYTVILLENSNNYFNRQYKHVPHESFYDEVIDVIGYDDYLRFPNINFPFNDGVETELVLNWPEATYNGKWDYLLLCNNDDNYVESTWFVLDCIYLRNGQYKLRLRRDVVNDFADEFLYAPAFIEKGTITDINNPLLFNSENMSFSQIKYQTQKITENEDIGYIVGYVAQPQEEETDKRIIGETRYTYDYLLEELPFALDEYYNYIQNARLYVFCEPNNNIESRYTRCFSFNETWYVRGQSTYDIPGFYWGSYGTGYVSSYPTTFKNKVDMSYGVSAFMTKMNDLINPENYYWDRINWDDPMFYNGKIVYDAENDVYYKLKIEADGMWNNEGKVSYNDINYGTDIEGAFGTFIKQSAKSYRGTAASGYSAAWYNILCTNYYINYEEVQPMKIELTIPASRPRLNDAPYSMFVIPYPKYDVRFNYSTGDVQEAYINKSVALNAAFAIGEQLGDALYDIQLLPYNPISNIWNDDDWAFNLVGKEENVDFQLIKKYTTSEVVGFIAWAEYSNFETAVTNFSLSAPNPGDPVKYKVEDATTLVKLVSPNRNNSFEFSPTKNHGVSWWNIQCTYKPYSPFIRVAPQWGGLYGENNDVDARGLICGGDYSLAVVKDAWKQYELNNKNYENIFNRGMANMDALHEINQINQGFQAITGTVQGVALGGALGGPAGMMAGGTASLAGGLADIYLSEQAHKENKDYQKDLYNYNLGNIKAMPDSLTKTSVQSPIFTIFPTYEMYEATEVEKQMLRDKIQYNGMTVNAIGTIRDYSIKNEECFVKGQLIRINGVGDTHVANALYNELQKGLFINRVY